MVFNIDGSTRDVWGHWMENTSGLFSRTIAGPPITIIRVFFSIVLMAITDANKECVYVHVGTPGHYADGGTWQQTDFKQAIDSGDVVLPGTYQLYNTDTRIPYHFVSDDAFQLTTRNLKPYSLPDMSLKQAVFN